MAVLEGSGQYYRTSMCALVLEDEPVGSDSRLEFESFPGEVDETYSVNQYREMGGDRMPQPSHIAYRGGSWSPWTLTLVFRAGIRQADQATANRPARPGDLDNASLEQQLIEMERKVRWCQALTFPLERSLGGLESRRIQAQVNAANAQLGAQGLPPSGLTTQSINGLRRNDPPIVLVVFGSWWVQRAYAENVSIKWQGPWHPESVRPFGAEVSITLKPLKAVYPTWNLIREQAGVGGFNNANPFVTGVVNESRIREARRRANNAGVIGTGSAG